MVALQQHYVRPAAEDLTETVLTEECRIQTGMSDEAIKNAQPLEQVLEEVSYWESKDSDKNTLVSRYKVTPVACIMKL